MAPMLVREPFHRPGWIYERKEDGWRMLAYKDGAHVRLISRQGVDHTARFSELAGAIAKLPARTLVLDGEVCVFDRNLVSQFDLLGDERPEEPATPPVSIAFDALYLRGRDITSKPLSYRRQVLEDEIAGSSFVLPALRLEGDGLAAWDQVKRNSWEGLVAKDASSSYRAGPTRSWLKVKIRREARFVVVGFHVPVTGACSLLLAARRGRRLVYIGPVQWGVTRALVAKLREASEVREVPACSDAEGGRGVVWLEPATMVEVTYSEIMQRRLRDPVVRRMGTRSF